MRQETIKMAYIGNCLSVNHRYGRRKDGGYYVKPAVRAWEEEYQWLLKSLHLEDWRLPLSVTCSAWFKDERSACDLVNFQKSVLDPIEELTGINDSNFRWHDGTRNIGVKEPYLLITIKEAGIIPEIPPNTLQSKSTPLKTESNTKHRVKRDYTKGRG